MQYKYKNKPYKTLIFQCLYGFYYLVSQKGFGKARVGKIFDFPYTIKKEADLFNLLLGELRLLKYEFLLFSYSNKSECEPVLNAVNISSCLFIEYIKSQSGCI